MQNKFDNTQFLSYLPHERVFQITQRNFFYLSHDDWQLFLKNNVDAYLFETSIIVTRFSKKTGEY